MMYEMCDTWSCEKVRHHLYVGQVIYIYSVLGNLTKKVSTKPSQKFVLLASILAVLLMKIMKMAVHKIIRITCLSLDRE